MREVRLHVKNTTEVVQPKQADTLELDGNTTEIAYIDANGNPVYDDWA